MSQIGRCGQAGVQRGRLLGAVGDHRAASRLLGLAVHPLSRSRPPQEYAKVRIDIELAEAKTGQTPTTALLLHEDEIRSVEGRGG